MAKRKLKCPKCDRRFSMAAHLARHLNTTHRSKAKKKAAGKSAVRRRPQKRAAKRAAPRGRRTGSVRSMSAIGAAGVLSSLRAYNAELTARCAAVDTQLRAVDAAIGALGAAPARASSRPAKRRARGAGGGRAGSLKTYILKVLRQLSTPQSPRQIATRVVKAGYRSKAKDLAKAVGNALPETKGVKRVGFGEYRA